MVLEPALKIVITPFCLLLSVHCPLPLCALSAIINSEFSDLTASNLKILWIAELNALEAVPLRWLIRVAMRRSSEMLLVRELTPWPCSLCESKPLSAKKNISEDLDISWTTCNHGIYAGMAMRWSFFSNLLKFLAMRWSFLAIRWYTSVVFTGLWRENVEVNAISWMLFYHCINIVLILY